MKVTRIEYFFKGWFVGDFEPSFLKTKAAEVAIKTYSRGEVEQLHYHKVATEITAIISGEVLMNNVKYITGDVIRIDPGEKTNFEAITDVTTVVVKVPGASNDKYLA